MKYLLSSMILGENMAVENINLAFFNLGPWEILLILIVVLILFGARRLPELAKSLGQGINEFRDSVDSSKKEIIDDLDTDSKNNVKNLRINFVFRRFLLIILSNK